MTYASPPGRSSPRSGRARSRPRRPLRSSRSSHTSALAGADVAIAGLAPRYAELFAPLLVVEAADLERGLRLFEDHAELGAFDAVLAAAALTREASALVSADEDFRVVRGLRFVMPGTQPFDDLLVGG